MTSIRTKASRLLMAAAVVGAGFTGYSAASFVPSAHAEAVQVEAPAAPGFADVVEAVSPAVVSVRVKSDISPVSDRMERPDFFEGLPDDHPFRRFFREFERGERGQMRPERERPRRARPISQGSGFFISGDGLLVTNNHVIENGTEFTVVMDDGTEYDAELIGADPRTDLAVLKVEEEREFTYVEFGDDNATRVGDWVVAVGNPFGLGGTVTAGIVSARGRDIGAGPYDDFLQIDAAVNRGNSGGPTFDLSGRVVGVNTAIFSPSGGNVGIAFAVPASVAKDVVADLIDDGNVERGWLGVSIQPVTDEIAESLGLDEARGAIVSDTQSGTPAADAGIQPGDVIASVDGTVIEGPRELSRTIADYDPGSDIEIIVIRDGAEETIAVKLGELPSDLSASAEDEGTEQPVEPTTLDDFGLTVTPTEEGTGVLVTAVEPGSVADETGIRAGDVIAEVNNQPVSAGSDVSAVLDDVEASGRRSALMRIERDNNSRFVAMRLAS